MRQGRQNEHDQDNHDATSVLPAPGKRTLVESVQFRANGPAAEGTDVQAAAAQGVSGPATALPHVDRIQASFGEHDLSHVEAHVGGAATAASEAIGATAYATGSHVAFASQPDLHTAAHEAAHVVQQAQGVNLYGGVGQAGDVYEQNADAVADRVVAGKSAADLLGGPQGGVAPAVQRKKDDKKHADAAPDEPGHEKLKKRGSGYTYSGGGPVKAALTKLANEGKLHITPGQIAQLDAVSQVETSGSVASVDTTDDQVVSIGFHQVVLGHKSVEAVIKKAPSAFAKHGIALDTSKTYDFASKPHQIVGAEHQDELRNEEWSRKFYEASLEPDVIVAITEFALAELHQVEGITQAAGGKADFFKDDTASAWLLEVHNNRPAYTGPSVKRAVASGAADAKSRDQFLDILAASIVQTYSEMEPELLYKKAKASASKKHKLTADEDAALKAAWAVKGAKIGHEKGSHIVTKMSRHLALPQLSGGAAAPAASAPAPAPAPAAKAPGAEQLMSLPAPAPEDMTLHPEELMCVADPQVLQSIAPAPAANQSIAPAAAPPSPAPAAPEAHAEPHWIVHAREYNNEHAAVADDFKAATSGATLDGDGHHDPVKVHAWQQAHGLHPDGCIGQKTLHAAKHKDVEPETPAHAPAPPPPPPAPAHAPAPASVHAAPTPTPAPAPTPAPPPAPVHAKEPEPAAPKKAPEPAAAAPPKPVEGHAPPTDQMFQHVYSASGQQVAVFVSPGGLTATPDVFMFLHGHDAQYGIDDQQKDKKGVISGIDVAAEAVAHAKGKNVVALLPQGVIGGNADRKHEGGYMKGLEGGLGPFLESVLGPLAADLHMKGLTPGRISVAGHSAGGYQGIASTFDHAGGMEDSITDVTLMDSDYAPSHFAAVAKWLFKGKSGKSLRITESQPQLDYGVKGGTKYGPFSGALPTFGHDALAGKAKHAGMTVEFLDSSKEDHGKHNKAILHAHILKDGAFHADVLILRSDRGASGHHQIRDDVMDDAILNIGQGAEGAMMFGQENIEGHGKASIAGLKGGDNKDAAVPAKPEAPKHVEKAAEHHDEPVHAEAKEAKRKEEATKKEKVEKAAEHHDETKHADAPAKAAPSGAPKAAHPTKGYDRDTKTGLDSYGNAWKSTSSKHQNLVGTDKKAFTNPFTTIEAATLYDGQSGKKLPHKLPSGTRVFTEAVGAKRIQIVTDDIKIEDHVWIDFSSLGGKGSDVAFGNEDKDPADKERAEAIKAGLPQGRNIGKSAHKWHFGSGFNPALDGIALDGSLMSKVYSLMQWAIHNDMVVGDISINSGMRSPADAQYLCIRYQLRYEGFKNIDWEKMQALPGGKDQYGHKWYEPGWTKEQVIEHATNLYEKKKDGSLRDGAQAAAGFDRGDSRRSPLKTDSGPNQTRHASGHAVDVDIPWRSAADPKKPDVWGWEQIYHQFGLTRPLHHALTSYSPESWHIEETDKVVTLGPDHND